ncbi:MAG: putative peptidoglycan lipid II flippase [Gammaproteobacteria bacterium]|jgi:putative peptidoglycan lipid II flippase
MLKSALTVGVGTTVSRVLGLVRDVLIAQAFGATSGADAFLVAFRIPNFLRRLFAEGAFSQAFVPVLSEYRATQGEAATKELVGATTGALACVLLVVTAMCVVFASVLVWVFAPGFAADAEKSALTTSMLRLTFPYLFLISLTALAGAVLNTFGRFAIPAVTPVFLNISLIGAALLLAPELEQPVMALAWGVLLGGVAQLMFQLPFLLRIGMLARPTLKRSHEGVTRIAKLMLPALFGVSVSQINLLVDTIIASFLTAGSVAWLYFSDRLVEFPLGVFGVALATVVLPALSSRHVEQAPVAFSNTLDWALRLTMVIGLPSSLGLALLGGPMLSTVFEYGAFDAHSVAMARRSLLAYSSGLVAFMAIKILASGFFSRQDIRTPVRVAAVAMVSNIGFSLCLVLFLDHAGLALATSMSAWLNALLLWRGLRKADVYHPGAGWLGLSVRVLAALTVMSLAIWLVRGESVVWGELDAWERVFRLLNLIGAGAGGYLATLFALGLRPSAFIRPRG